MIDHCKLLLIDYDLVNSGYVTERNVDNCIGLLYYGKNEYNGNCYHLTRKGKNTIIRVNNVPLPYEKWFENIYDLHYNNFLNILSYQKEFNIHKWIDAAELYKNIDKPFNSLTEEEKIIIKLKL